MTTDRPYLMRFDAYYQTYRLFLTVSMTTDRPYLMRSPEMKQSLKKDYRFNDH